MKAAVITFPGSNCDRDLAVALEQAGFGVSHVWHKDDTLPAGTDVVAIPGGFSYGDYLRSGAIAAHAPVSAAIRAHAARGGLVLGVCNGFQVLTEMRLLPGALVRNAGLRFVCRAVRLRVENTASPFTGGYRVGQEVRFPVAHGEGNYTIDPEGLKVLEGEGRIAFRYLDNPNGSAADIAGVLSPNLRVLGLMPHPERALDPLQGSGDGTALFTGLLGGMVPA